MVRVVVGSGDMLGIFIIGLLGLLGGNDIFAPFVINVENNQPYDSACDKEENKAEEIYVNLAAQKNGDDGENGKHHQTATATFHESGTARRGNRRGRGGDSDGLWWFDGDRFTPLGATTPARIKLIFELRIASKTGPHNVLSMLPNVSAEDRRACEP